jgi:membrane protein
VKRRLEQLRERFRRLRDRFPVLDHGVRAVDRNGAVLGGQLAAAITYFGFLSFFPLLALGFSLVGYISNIYPSAQGDVTRAVQSAFPSLIGSGKGQINVQDIIDARRGTGAFALLGLLYAGMGWLDALRDALRRVFATADVAVSFLKKKATDVVVLALLGTSLIGSLGVTSMATAATTFVLDHVGLNKTTAAIVFLKVLSVAFAILADTLLFAIVLSRLSGAKLTWHQVRSGALLAAIGFEVLKLIGTFLIGRTTSNPVYATFGVVVGLLVWMNFVAKLTVFAAAWTATGPYSLVPAEPGSPGVGRATALASSTEPVRAVAPPDFDLVPAPPRGPQPTRSRVAVWKAAGFGALTGAGATAWLLRRRGRS